MGRLVKSGSLGSARGAQPTVEAGVAHSECAPQRPAFITTCQTEGKLGPGWPPVLCGGRPRL